MRFECHIPALVIVCCLASAGWAQVDDSLNNPHSPSGMVRPDALVYEGLLVYLESPVDGEVDMVVTAWDRPMGGEPLDGPTLYEGVRVESGWFRVELEPTLLQRGRGFAWLEVAVRWPAGLGEFEMLDGRQRLDFASVSFVPNQEVEGAVLEERASGELGGSNLVEQDVPGRRPPPSVRDMVSRPRFVCRGARSGSGGRPALQRHFLPPPPPLPPLCAAALWALAAKLPLATYRPLALAVALWMRAAASGVIGVLPC